MAALEMPFVKNNTIPCTEGSHVYTNLIKHTTSTVAHIHFVSSAYLHRNRREDDDKITNTFLKNFFFFKEPQMVFMKRDIPCLHHH